MKKDTQQVCPATELFVLLSKRHMLVLLHTLTSGKKGYSELAETLHINTATLAVRLKDLEDAGIVAREACMHDMRSHYYMLTKRGMRISALIEKLGDASRITDV
jgi:DNA-binding HxlR family transcriptional regulator